MDESDFATVIDRLRRQGTDDATTEVKAAAESLGKSVWDSVSAFANTAGGWIILGVSEELGFQPVEGFRVEAACSQFIDGMGDGNEQGARLVNPPAYHVNRFDFEGQQVLAIEILENGIGAKPCYIKSKGVETGSYKRIDDRDVRLSRSEIFSLQTAHTISEADRALVEDCSADDLDPKLVDLLVTAPGNARAVRRLTERGEMLARLNVTDNEGHVRLAGLLTVGDYPQQFFPQLYVDVSVHPTVEKASATTQLRFLDRVECAGPLSEVVSDAVSAVARNLRTCSVVTGAGRTDELEIPEEVLREAIGNAVLHREYHPMFLGQAVAVDIYPDRVTVTSPGGLWQKTRDNIGNGISKCRNQTLLQMLKNVPSLGSGGKVAEGQGGGVPLMRNEMRARSLESPEFTVTPDSVTVEFRRHGADSDAHRRWARDAVGRDLARGEDALLAIARREGRVTVTTARDQLGMDSDDARHTLHALTREGVLTPIGTEEFALFGAPAAPADTEEAVLNSLSPMAPISIAELSELIGKSRGSLRPVLRRLVEKERVRATAPPQSRHRRYLLVEDSPTTG